MKNKISILFFLVIAFSANAQVKKWTLRECVEYALKNNISVRQSELDLKTTEVTKSDAVGNFLPSASLSAGHSWNIGLTQNLSGILQQQTTQFTTAGLSTQVDIYKGLQNQMQLRRAKMAIIAGQYQLQKMKDDIGLNVANAFLDILFNKENLKVQQQQLQIDTEQAARAKQLLEGGQIPRGDLMDIEATVSTDRQRVVQAENTLLISKLSLAQLLQLDDFATFDIADEEYNMEDSEVFLQTPEAIYEKAKTLRTEIKLAQANLDVAEQDVKIARSAYQPSLIGFYSLNTRATYNDYTTFNDSGELITQSPPPFWTQFWDNKGHSFGLQLSIPVLNGFATRNNVERSKITLER
ncbi:MAG: TolC family protein, partial [Bacteroidota bacterium]